MNLFIIYFYLYKISSKTKWNYFSVQNRNQESWLLWPTLSTKCRYYLISPLSLRKLFFFTPIFNYWSNPQTL